jgi:hypothetical protein
MQVTGFLYYLSLTILNPKPTPAAILVESLIFISTMDFFIFFLLSVEFLVQDKLMPAYVPNVTKAILI